MKLQETALAHLISSSGNLNSLAKLASLVGILSISSTCARPIGEGFVASNHVDFQADWKELEQDEAPPLLHLQKPYWKSHAQKHLDAMGYEKKRFPDPVALSEDSFHLRILALDASDWDQNFGFGLNALGGADQTLGFDTHGPALELGLNQDAAIGKMRLRWLYFGQDEEIVGPQSSAGYKLVFGGRHSDMLGLAETDLHFLRAGRDVELEHRGDMRLGWVQGISWFHLKRFERVRGNDRLGLNTKTLLRDPANPALGSDPVVLEQGEDAIESSGPGLFTGFAFERELNGSLSFNAEALVHLSFTNEDQSLRVEQISRAGVASAGLSRQHHQSGTRTILDLNLELRRWMRKNTSFSLGYRYLQFSRGDRKNLRGDDVADFGLRGVTVGWHRRF